MTYFNKHLSDLEQKALQIEVDWLQSIDAPFTRLPKHVAEAIAIRVLLQSLPLDQASTLSEMIVNEDFLEADEDILAEPK